jgi:hypothetical protein
MERLQMAKEALQDFKKYKDSKQCRHYNNIINTLRAIPCGVADRSMVYSFEDFIPFKDRRGVALDKVVEIVLQLYVGYSEAMSDPDLKKLIAKRYSQIYYQKNKDKIKANSKKFHEENKKRRNKQSLDHYHADSKYHYERYKHNKQEYAYKNKEKLAVYIALWREENPKKVKKYYRNFDSKKRIEKLKQRGLI